MASKSSLRPHRLRAFVNGRDQALATTAGAGTRARHLIDPTNNTPHSFYESTTPIEIRDALQVSSDAQRKWKLEAPAIRSRILRQAADIILQNEEHLSNLETLDTGRPIRETQFDVQDGAECLYYYSGVANTLGGSSYEMPGGSLAYTIREPLGVTVGIGAWNYPLQSALWKSAPALAFGNSIVFKPSEFTPSTALWLGQCYKEAGLPDGLFNVILGAKDVGAELVQSDLVSKVSFTGSAESGRKVYEMAASGMKKVTMELGGKSPLIIFSDSDLDNAVSGAMLANWYSSGQVCSNGTRVFVHDSIADDFVDRLVKRTKKLRIGDPTNVTTDIGPMCHREQYQKVLDYVRLGQEEGATLLYGGKEVDKSKLPDTLRDGLFLTPAIFTECNDNMRIVKEEVFGMLMTILTFSDEEEVIARANKTRFGLGAGVFTSDIQRGHRVVSRLEAGCTWINTYNVAPVQLPWGGMKGSGIGRENGEGAIESWTQLKSVYCEMNDVETDYVQ